MSFTSEKGVFPSVNLKKKLYVTTSGFQKEKSHKFSYVLLCFTRCLSTCFLTNFLQKANNPERYDSNVANLKRLQL